MTFNEEELLKIQKATSGLFKKYARINVSAALFNLGSKIRHFESDFIYEEERKAFLKECLEEATAERKRALQSGANSYGDQHWAPAAACESLLLELLNGTPESIARVETIVNELISAGAPKNDDPYNYSMTD